MKLSQASIRMLTLRRLLVLISSLAEAAEQGQRQAQAMVGYMYAAGRGTPKDLESAYAWIAAAQSEGEPHIQDSPSLAEIERQLSLEAIQRAKERALGCSPSHQNGLPPLPYFTDRAVVSTTLETLFSPSNSSGSRKYIASASFCSPFPAKCARPSCLISRVQSNPDGSLFLFGNCQRLAGLAKLVPYRRGAINGGSGGPVIYSTPTDGVQIVGSIATYFANRANGEARPVSRWLQTFSTFRRLSPKSRTSTKLTDKKKTLQAESSSGSTGSPASET